MTTTWKSVREARLGREAAEANAAWTAAAEQHAREVELAAEALAAHPELLVSPEPGQPGEAGLQGPQGPPGPEGPHVVNVKLERGAYGYISGLLDTLSDGTTRHLTVVRVNGRPVELRQDA